MPTAWGADETIVLLFFSSCKVSQAACKRLIAERCGTKRKVTSIRGRLTSLRNITLRQNKPTLYDCKAKIWLRRNVDDWIDSQDHSNLQWLIRFDEADAKVVTRYQKIDPVLEAMSHSSLLAKNRFRSAVSTDQSVPSPVDEPDEEVDVSTDLFVPPPVGEPDEEADVSTDQFVPSPVDEPDEEVDEDIYLFRYFIKYVLWLIFPVVKVSQNHITKSIIDSLESNPCSLRFCLSIAAIHLKYMEGCKGLTEADIMRHRHAATLEHCKAMESDHRLVLEAALSTIFIQCSDDFLSDIPWRHHLEAGVLLVKELKLPLQHPLMSLTAWVDILGATMVARSPVFAHVYREMRETGLALGLFQLMGCEDRIMCVISEIACLEELKASGAIDHIQLCNRVITLSVILNESELAFESNYPYSLDGALVLNLLLGNISVIFRIATRIYLCSVIDSKDETAIGDLINDFTAAMHYIPLGFERSLVWPLLIAGSMSIPQSTFRTFFTSRIADASEAGFGRFGHMVSLVQEVWHQSKQSDSGSNAHWRDVMKAKGWDFILV